MSNASGSCTLVNPSSIIVYTGYWAMGLFAAVGNLFIIFIIIKTKELRTKDFYIVFGLAVADFVVGVSYLAEGLSRFFIAVLCLESSTTSIEDCLARGYVITRLFGTTGSVLMMVAVAVDRLISVAAYKLYAKFGKRYAVLLVTLVFCICTCITVEGLVHAIEFAREGKEVAVMCYASHVMSNEYYIASREINVGLGVLSFVCYLAVVLILLIKKHILVSGSGGIHMENAYQREIQVTKTAGIIVTASGILVTFPAVVQAAAKSNGPLKELFSSFILYTHPLVPFNSGINIFVYAFKYVKFREAVFRCFHNGKVTIYRSKDLHMASHPKTIHAW